jgi:3-hydroxyisobutyrate dehydrogenase
MGLPMARTLIAAGHEVAGSDLDRARVEALGGADVTAPAEIAITSLPSAEAVEQVARSLPGTGVRTFVDMSTGPPALARRLADELGAAGIESVDAPVSGGPRGAEAATLSIFVGGSPEAFSRVEPVLSVLGSVVALVGGPGAGQVVKLCNNLIAGVTMVSIAEACAVAQRAGIDAATLYGLITHSTGDSRVLRTRFPLPGADESHPANRHFEPMFMLDLIVKDMALASYRKAQQRELGRLDYSAVYLSLAARSQ